MRSALQPFFDKAGTTRKSSSRPPPNSMNAAGVALSGLLFAMGEPPALPGWQ